MKIIRCLVTDEEPLKSGDMMQSSKEIVMIKTNGYKANGMSEGVPYYESIYTTI